MSSTMRTYPTLATALADWFHEGAPEAYDACVSFLTPRLQRAFARLRDDCVDDHVQDFLVAKLDRARGLLDPARVSDPARYLTRTISNFRRDLERQRATRRRDEIVMPGEDMVAFDPCCPQRRLENRDALRRTLDAMVEAPVGARIAWLLTARLGGIVPDMDLHVRALASSLGEDEDAVLTRAAAALASGTLDDAIRVLVPAYDATDRDAPTVRESFERQARRGRAEVLRLGGGFVPWSSTGAMPDATEAA
jgi:hypothetical protein